MCRKYVYIYIYIYKNYIHELRDCQKVAPLKNVAGIPDCNDTNLKLYL